MAESDGGIGPENLLSAIEMLERNGRCSMSPERVPERSSPVRLRAVTCRRESQVTPNHEQYGVESFHEERTGGVASVMASWRERRARYSEMGEEKTWWKWKRKRRRRKRRRIFE